MPNTFAPPKPLETAVLFLVFNRLDTTMQVFEAIRTAKPPRLYVAADGARKSRAGEDAKVAAVRDYIMERIDWKCEVKTLFREENLGCKRAVSSAIDWFFENEEMGIILEDDCLPEQSFFWYCETLLQRYKYDQRIGQICGFNPLGTIPNDHSYCYSKYGPIWGWASWRRAWESYDVKMKTWPVLKEQGLFKAFCDSETEARWRIALFDKVAGGEIDTWDYQWAYAKLANSHLCIIPAENLVENIGFNEDATHTTSAPVDLPSSEEITFPLTPPDTMMRNIHFDAGYFQKFVGVNPSLIRKILYKLKAILS